MLEEHKLALQILLLVNGLLDTKGLILRAGTVVDATLIAAPSSSKNASGERDPQMKQSKKGNQWYFAMKAHISVDGDSGLVHTVRGTAGSVNDVIEANTLLHGQESEAWAMPGSRALTSALTPKPACAGTSRCVLASDASWTRPCWLTN